jgi:hypothetical protein
MPQSSWRTEASFLGLLLLSPSTCLCESYSEHFLVHDLDEQYSASTFAAIAEGTTSVHQRTFPLPLAALFDTYPLKHFKLTLSRGRWRNEWCVLLSPAPRSCTLDEHVAKW